MPRRYSQNCPVARTPTVFRGPMGWKIGKIGAGRGKRRKGREGAGSEIPVVERTGKNRKKLLHCVIFANRNATKRRGY